jgi:hypothetical protein
MTMPCRWGQAGLPDFTGRVRFRRRFGYPGCIDEQERVWLTFAGISDDADIRLNDQFLGRAEDSSGCVELEVTRLLRARNELVVDIEGTAEQGGLWGEVALEVRCTAWLRKLERTLRLRGEQAELRVSGQVVGVAERPLELYIVLDRSVVAYQTITATSQGQPFDIVVPAQAERCTGATAESDKPVVKIELVNGACVWYTSEAAVTIEPMLNPGE